MTRAVLLLAFGGPEKFEDVRPFLANVLRGKNVPPERVETVVEQYRAIGGKSPINELTFRQAAELEKELALRGLPHKTYVGMRHWAPSVKDALERMRANGVKKAVGLVLSNFHCEASWDKYLEAVEDARKSVGADAPLIEYADAWNESPEFINAQARAVQDAAQPGDALIFTAHSIPLAMDRASGYSEQMRKAAQAVAECLNHADWHVAFQSRSGSPRDPWLEPDIGDKIAELATRGVKAVTVVPIGFVCDHVEVLFDLDVKARKAAMAAGVEFRRAKTVGDQPAFTRLLAERVQASCTRETMTP